MEGRTMCVQAVTWSGEMEKDSKYIQRISGYVEYWYVIHPSTGRYTSAKISIGSNSFVSVYIARTGVKALLRSKIKVIGDR
jgi:hypothetical protein